LFVSFELIEYCLYSYLILGNGEYLQMSAGKPRMFHSVPNARPGVDVIFIDCPENLPVPGLSTPLHKVPECNADVEAEALQLACSFAAPHLQDDGCIIVFHSWSVKAKSDIAGVCETYQLVKKKEWMGMNRMHLTLAIDDTKTVNSIQFFGFHQDFIIYCIQYILMHIWLGCCRLKSLESPSS